MTPDQWARLKELFEAALEQPPEQRSRFAERLSSGDVGLCRALKDLLRQHEAAGRFLEGTGEPQTYSLPAGALLAERFRVVGPIGRGGMGEVYEVFDEELKERSALKILRPELACDKDSIARLTQEVQLARRVTHPNVCRLFDLRRERWNDREIAFLTMELLEGETLRDRLKHEGPMAAAAAIQVARQIAAGLDAAHAAGIVHRDFKSANILLSPAQGGGERAVITDFGLARGLSPDQASLTATGMIAGTPAYMAPEQQVGGTVTAAADIFAFGIVLREMRTGTAAPANEDALEPLWRKAIGRCLERDAARRPASASEAVRSLSTRARRRVWVLALAAALGIAVALAAIGGLSRSLPFFRSLLLGATIPNGALIVLADFQNTTGDHDLDAVTEVFRSQIRQSARVKVWDPARLPAVLQGMAKPPGEPLTDSLLREIALREGTSWCIFGSVSPLAGELVINLRLEELAVSSPHARRTWNHALRAPGKTALHDSIHDASIWLRDRLGESSGEIASRDRLPQDTTSSSWRALAAYAEAERFQRSGKSESAIALLRTAVGEDPEFALAHMRLGDILMAQRRQSEGLREWGAAISEKGRRHLTLREELRIQGLYASDTWDYTAAEAAFTRMEKEYPMDYLASFYLAHELKQQGRFDEAASHLLEADRKEPGSTPVLANLAGVYFLMRNHAGLDSVISRLRALSQGNTAERYAGLKGFVLRRYDEALESFRRGSQSGSIAMRSRGFSELAGLFAELGRYGEARETLHAGIEFDSSAGRRELRAGKHLALGYLALRESRRAEVRRLAAEALADDKSPGTLMRAAILNARAGYLAEAASTGEAAAGQYAPGAPLRRLIQARTQGEIALSAGKTGEALDAMRTANSIEPPINHRAYLARALESAGIHDEALVWYRRTFDTPELLWQNADYGFPGELTDMLWNYARLAVKSGQLDQARSALSLYLERRSGSPLADVRMAKALLNSTLDAAKK